MADPRVERMARLLDERGHTVGPVRVAAGPSGVAIGVPREPIVHASWAALAGLALLVTLVRSRRRSGASPL